jgi:hypothetical protein
MKKSFLLFCTKCFLIVFLASCTSVDDIATAKTVTPLVTNGTWKVSLYMDANNDQTNDFAGYTFTFNRTGELTASKNGTDVTGNWMEDTINKKIAINMGSSDPVLEKLNNSWHIASASSGKICFDNAGSHGTDRLSISQ